MITDLTKKWGTLPKLAKSLGKLFSLIDKGLEGILGKAYHLTRPQMWSLNFYRRNRKRRN